MARIKIKDLPAGMTLSKDELKRVKGGLISTPFKVFPKVESRVIPKLESTHIDTGDFLTNPTIPFHKY